MSFLDFIAALDSYSKNLSNAKLIKNNISLICVIIKVKFVRDHNLQIIF